MDFARRVQRSSIKSSSKWVIFHREKLESGEFQSNFESKFSVKHEGYFPGTLNVINS